MEYTAHDDAVQKLGLLIEKDSRYGLVKYFVPWGDAKTDLVGPFYPDVTCLRREGRKKVMIEVQSIHSFEDPDEIRRLEGLSEYCAANQWEFYIGCTDEKVRELTQAKLEGRSVRTQSIFLISEAPFTSDKIGSA